MMPRTMPEYSNIPSLAAPLGRTVTGVVGTNSSLRSAVRRGIGRPQTEATRLRRVGYVWMLLFFNVLGSGTTTILHVPRPLLEAMTQGALGAALALALSVNPKLRVRGNVFLSLYSLLGILTIMMSVRVPSVGANVRALRLLGFLAVLWLLTPWWGRRDVLLLRSQAKFLLLIIASVILGLLMGPGHAFDSGRLSGILWPIPPTQVAHYAAELSGLALLAWSCRLVSRRTALIVALPSIGVLLLTHTRTALVAGLVGALVAGLSLFAINRRVRRAFAITVIVVAVAGIPLAPFVVNYLARGESSQGISTLSGRTSHWAIVVDEQRPETNKLLGSGESNDFAGGQAIDSTWLSTYQNQGLVGDALVGMMFLTVLVGTLLSPPGPSRAIALFLVAYCLVASFTETGMGEASQYALDMALAASLIMAPPSPRFRGSQ